MFDAIVCRYAAILYSRDVRILSDEIVLRIVMPAANKFEVMSSWNNWERLSFSARIKKLMQYSLLIGRNPLIPFLRKNPRSFRSFRSRFLPIMIMHCFSCSKSDLFRYGITFASWLSSHTMFSGRQQLVPEGSVSDVNLSLTADSISILWWSSVCTPTKKQRKTSHFTVCVFIITLFCHLLFKKLVPVNLSV